MCAECNIQFFLDVIFADTFRQITQYFITQYSIVGTVYVIRVAKRAVYSQIRPTVDAQMTVEARFVPLREQSQITAGR